MLNQLDGIRHGHWKDAMRHNGMANDSAVQTEIGYTGLANPFQVQYCGHHKLCARSGNNVAIACQLTSQPVRRGVFARRTHSSLVGQTVIRIALPEYNLVQLLSQRPPPQTVVFTPMHAQAFALHGLVFALDLYGQHRMGVKAVCVYTDKLVRSVLFYSKQNDSRKNGNIPLVPNR